MVTITVLCPYCGSDDIGLGGKSRTGKQRYKCRNSECAHKSFQLEYVKNAYKPGVKQQIIDMAMNGSGTRDTGRVLKISPNTVTAVLKKRRDSPNKSTRITSGSLTLTHQKT